MLDKVEQVDPYRWQEVFNFLRICRQSVNSRPPTRKFSFVHHAAAQNDIEVARQLMKLGANCFYPTWDNMTPKEVALSRGFDATARFFEELESKRLYDDR